MEGTLASFLQAFATLFFIMDPFSSVPVFLAISKNHVRDAVIAAGSAGIVLIAFIMGGTTLLELLDLRVEDIQIAGGILLLFIALQYALGFESKHTTEVSIPAVIIGVPLITGPGTLTASIILVNSFGIQTTLAAAIVAVVASFVILRFAATLQRLVGAVGLAIFSRLFSLILAAIAISFIRKGITAIV